MSWYILFVLIMSFALPWASAQTKFAAKDNITIKVTGTSTLHDWEMKSNAGDCTATFTLNNEGAITGFEAMSFQVSSKALRSGKGAMDRNAYKALKADTHTRITAVLLSGTVTQRDPNHYTLRGRVRLTIAGKSLDTDLVATVKRVNDTSFSVKGEKHLNMKQFDMEPPSFMMGTVKTGEDVTLGFDLVLHQK